MEKKWMIAAIVRTWKNDKVVEAVRFLLGSEQINYVVVAINADIQNGGEENGAYTKALLKNAFGLEPSSKLIIHPITNWGKNPGSAAAINDATSELFYRLRRLPRKNDIILNLSVESKITLNHISAALNLFNRIKNLAVVGIERKIVIGENQEDFYLAEEFQNHLQYKIPQNTASFWRADLLRLAGGFRTECDFSGMTIEIEGQEVPVAGMEDFPSLCALVRASYKWAMLKDNPMVWNLRDIKKDESRWGQNLRKMKRQERVMEIWVQKYFGLRLEELLSLIQEKEVTETL